MVNSEAISEIDRLVEHHLSVARALQVARAHLAGDAPVSTSFPALEERALSPVGSNLVPHMSDRATRINALNGTEFFHLKYNDSVAAALQVWGSEEPRPKQVDVLRILKKGGFVHPQGDAGAKASIRNASASGRRHGGSVIKLPDGDPSGEYALKEWFGNRVSVHRAKRKSPQQKETMVDPPIPEEQTDLNTQAEV